MGQIIKSFVDSYSPLLYSFNWQLYLDEVRAAKMTEETMALFLQGVSSRLGELAKPEPETRFQTQLKLFQTSYELFTNSHKKSDTSKAEHWSRLRPLERSALFLKHKCSLSYKDMETIYHVPAASLISTTHQAREFLLEGRSDLC